MEIMYILFNLIIMSFDAKPCKLVLLGGCQDLNQQSSKEKKGLLGLPHPQIF